MQTPVISAANNLNTHFNNLEVRLYNLQRISDNPILFEFSPKYDYTTLVLPNYIIYNEHNTPTKMFDYDMMKYSIMITDNGIYCLKDMDGYYNVHYRDRFIRRIEGYMFDSDGLFARYTG